MNLALRLIYFLKDFSFYIFLLLVIFLLFLAGSFAVFKSKIGKLYKNILVSVFFIIFCFVVVFSAFEGYFRYVWDAPDGLGFLRVTTKWTQRHVVYNGDFSRDREFVMKKGDGVLRIGVIGDSLTFGSGIENVDDRFGNLLEKKFASGAKKVEVYNFGVPGLDTGGEILRYKEKARLFDLDIVVLQYFPNDIGTEEKTAERAKILSAKKQKAGTINYLVEKSYFLEFLYWRFSQKYSKTVSEIQGVDLKEYENEVSFDRHKADLKDFVDAIKQDNSKVVVIVFPYTNLIGENYPVVIHNKLEVFFAENKVDGYVDMLDLISGKKPRELMASRFDAHPNEFVHALAAQRLFEVIDGLVQSEK